MCAVTCESWLRPALWLDWISLTYLLAVDFYIFVSFAFYRFSEHCFLISTSFNLPGLMLIPDLHNDMLLEQKICKIEIDGSYLYN